MIVSYTAEQAESNVEQFVDLLMDAVDSGASIGFMPPISRAEAFAYWQDAIAVIRTGHRLLLVATDEDVVQGSVQVHLEPRANGNHRAEVVKLFVHRRARRRGLAKSLMLEVESTARRLGRTLLLMDTRKAAKLRKCASRSGTRDTEKCPSTLAAEMGGWMLRYSIITNWIERNQCEKSACPF